MNDHEKDNEYEEFLKIFEKSHSSGSDDTQEDTPAIHRKQPLQEPRRSTRQMPPRPGSTSRQNSAPLSEYPVRRTQPTRKPGMYLSPKRKAAKKRRQRRLTIEKHSNRQKYCTDCARIMYLKNKAKYQRNKRSGVDN